MSNLDPENTNLNNVTPENKSYNRQEGYWQSNILSLDDLSDLYDDGGYNENNYGNNYYIED